MLPMLTSATELAAVLDRPDLRIFDATTFLSPGVGGTAPYRIESGRGAYAEAHIPGAAFADITGELSDPASPFVFTVPDADRFAAAIGALGVSNADHVVAYTQGPPSWATRLWWLLRYFGHERVSVLDGGLGAWKAAGGAVASGERRYPPAVFAPSPPDAKWLARLEDVAAIADGGGPAVLVNALGEAAFRGTAPSSYSRPGRIPGSVNVPSGSLLDAETGRFLAPERMREVLGAAGASGDRPVVTYCGGGISATVPLFALALLGHDDVRLYDGSLTEWSARPDLPLVTG